MLRLLHASARRRAGRRPFAVLLLPLAGALCPLACGDDTTSSGPAVPAQDQIQAGFGQLADFRDAAAAEPALQLLDTAEFGALLDSLGAPGSPVALAAPPGSSRPVRSLLRKLSASRRALTQTAYGTWRRDPSNTTGPFPGWSLIEPGNPPDGFVFRFDLDDGISVRDAAGTPIPIRGEFRFLEIQIDDRGTPEDPSDDLPLGLVIEIAATPEAEGELPVLVRLDLAAAFDAAGELQSFSVGDPDARSPSDPGAAFLGPVLLAVHVEGAPGSLAVLVQIYDSSENFVVRVEVSRTLDPLTEIVQSEAVSFGFGVTRQPASPPWEIALQADNFRADPAGGGDVADIHGTIRHRVLLATLAGDTTEVPIDTDGDEIPDDTCVNVTVTFVDAPNEPQNLCLALPALRTLFASGGMPQIGAPSMFRR